MPKYAKLGHVHINVTDLKRSLDFYTRIMGLKVAGLREPDKAWLNFGQYPASETRTFHDLAITQVPYRNDKYWETSGLNHLAFELESPQAVLDFANELRGEGIEIFRGPATHKGDGTFHIYIADPDQNAIEIYAVTALDDPKFGVNAAGNVEAAAPAGYKPY